MPAGRRQRAWSAFLLPLAGLALVVAGLLADPSPLGAQEDARFAYSVRLTGEINPLAERRVERALDEARKKGAAVAIIRLNTPGGDVRSMRKMDEDIVNAPLPVIVYVHPGGARAASAGLFVTQAADVAAMAPDTNIGSATPIGPFGDLPPDVRRKAVNDGVAHVRALAEDRGRNADLAERMVRKAVNVTAAAAMRRKLIDVVARTERGLLRRLDGFRIEGPKAQVLRTAGLPIEYAPESSADPSESSSISPLGWAALGLLGVAVLLALGALMRAALMRSRWA